MLPTQVLRYFRVLILLVGLVDTGLIIEYWVRFHTHGFDMLWDVQASHAVTWFLTLVSAFVAFGSRPRWLHFNLRGALVVIPALVLLIVKSHFVHRYLGERARIEQSCGDSMEIVMCRALPNFAWFIGFTEVPCGYVFVVMVIAEAIVTLRMDKRTQDTAEQAAVQDAEKNLSNV
ncbi:hypothetical protein BGX24_002341 [Mortierella sp. AD032]|nr:hypothetical protein BGX24_002341 [Mortierella sp. AD032]